MRLLRLPDCLPWVSNHLHACVYVHINMQGHDFDVVDFFSKHLGNSWYIQCAVVQRGIWHSLCAQGPPGLSDGFHTELYC